MSRLLKAFAALLLLAAPAYANSVISGLPAATVPLATNTCFVVDLAGSGTTQSLCSNYTTALGALAVSSNLSDLGNAATARTNLGLAAIAASGSASDLAAGTLPALRFPALTGAVTTPAGSLSTTLSAGAVGTGNLAGSAVTYAKIQNETAATLLGNPTGSSAAPSEITLGTGLSFSGGVLNATGGGSTTITAGPGLGNSQTSFNGTGTAQTVTNGSTLYPQMGSVAKTGAYTLNADCSSGVLCDTARVVLANGAGSIAITAPNPAGTLAPYQIADESGHGFTVPTAGGTASFAGCVTGSPTTLTVPANYLVQLFDQGAGNGYFCVLQQEQQAAAVPTGANPTGTAGPTANNGSLTTFMRSDATPAVQPGSGSQEGILQCGTNTSCSSGTISVPTGTSGAVIGLLNGNNTLGGNDTFSGTNSHTGTETFATVNGGVNVQSGTTYTTVATDCGKTLLFTSNSAVSVTIAASIVPASGTACVIGVLQGGTAKVSVNGSAVSAATLISAHSYTGTSGTAGSEIGLTLTTVSAATDAFLTGDGS